MKSHALNVNVRFTSADIDDQHRKLSEAIGELRREIDHGDDRRAREALEEFIQFLNSYFLFHTFTEEKLMFDNAYPRDTYFRHVREHKEVILDLVLLMEGETPKNHLRVSAAAPKERARQLLAEFEQWLREHVEKADAKLMEFLKARGI